MGQADLSVRRALLLSTHGGGRVISRSEYVALLLSRKPLERNDCADDEFCGLLDRTTGEQFFIDRSTLR